MKPKVSQSVVFVGGVTLPLCVPSLPLTMVFADTLGTTCIGSSPIPKHKNHVDNLLNDLHVSESTSSLLSEGPDVMKTIPCHIQGRSISECSVDSEDSIVFLESPGYGWDNDNTGCNDFSDSSDEEEEEEDDDDDDDDEMCIGQFCDDEVNDFDSDTEGGDETTEDTCDGPSQLVEEVNKRWQLENPPTAQKRKSNCLQKQVTFAPPESLESVRLIIAWSYAYRAARIGNWDQIVRDRDRFRTRIKGMEAILAPVLNPSHRKKMLELIEKLASSESKCDLF